MMICTIGFTKKSAEHFFALLDAHGVKRVVDIRLKPYGQLAGFSKQDDLRYFLKELINCDYLHLPMLAPTSEILESYQKDHRWDHYTRNFENLMDERDIPATLDQSIFEIGPICLLCSEDSPEQCHRRLIAERLARAWPNVNIHHLQ